MNMFDANDSCSSCHCDTVATWSFDEDKFTWGSFTVYSIVTNTNRCLINWNRFHDFVQCNFLSINLRLSWIVHNNCIGIRINYFARITDELSKCCWNGCAAADALQIVIVINDSFWMVHIQRRHFNCYEWVDSMRSTSLSLFKCSLNDACVCIFLFSLKNVCIAENHFIFFCIECKTHFVVFFCLFICSFFMVINIQIHVNKHLN